MSWIFRDYDATHDRTALDDILARSRDENPPDPYATVLGGVEFSGPGWSRNTRPGWHLINKNTTVERWVRDDDPLYRDASREDVAYD